MPTTLLLMGSMSSKPHLNFKMGCAIWAYKPWVGNLYPAGSSSTQFLQLYSQRFQTVEGNATFYAVPSPDTVARWAKETPEGFEFCPKLPRSITHDGSLLSHLDAARRFIALMQGLGNRLGPIFAQLPPTYDPQFWPDLEAFLSGLRECGSRLALEVRHPQWFQPVVAERLNALLQSLGMGRVLLDTRPIYECEDNPQLSSERRKPKLPLQPITTAPFTLIRYISHPNQAFNQRFMVDWISYLQNWLQQGDDIYLFVHCPVEVHSPQNARYFQQLLTANSLNIPPLPWDALQQPPAQLSLF
jgi:uncharacterized protein YecE (DUF72 family)